MTSVLLLCNSQTMEPDSTTYDTTTKQELAEPCFPFSTCPGNFQLYKDFTTNKSGQRLEYKLIERLQVFGLIPSSINCPSNKIDCKVVCKPARVIDRLQWLCEGCGKKQPIRTGTFFFRLQCTILQAMQIILAWCEDAVIEVAAEHFGVKLKIAVLIYDRLDELAIKEQSKQKFGGENSVVLIEMYPDCVNRQSPDTTDQPHPHRILMIADTNHIPTAYWLHVIKEENKKITVEDIDNQSLKSEIEEVVRNVVLPNSVVVTGNHVPLIDGASSIQQLYRHGDVDMQHFLSTRIWRQAVSLCGASGSARCTRNYLAIALFRSHHSHHSPLYLLVLRALALSHHTYT